MTKTNKHQEGKNPAEKAFPFSIRSIRKRFTKVNVFIFVVMFLFLIQFSQNVQTGSVTGKFSFLNMSNSSLIDEVGKLTQAVNTISSDLGEVRGFLSMPVNKYYQSDESEAADNESNNDAVQLALFKYVGYLSDQENLNKSLSGNLHLLNAISTDTGFASYLSTGAFSASKIDESSSGYYYSIYNANKQGLISFFLDKQNGNLNLRTVSAVEQMKETDSAKFIKYVEDFLTKNSVTLSGVIKQIDEKKTAIISAFQSAAITKIMGEKKLTFVKDPEVKDFKLSYSIKNSGGDSIATIILDKKDMSIQLKDNRDTSNMVLQVTDLSTSIPPFLNKLDTLPDAQKKVLDAQEKLKNTFADAGFQLLLKTSGLKVNTDPRQDEYRYYYDIFITSSDGKQKLLGSMVIEKATGLIEVVNPGGTDTTNILFFDPGLKKKL